MVKPMQDQVRIYLQRSGHSDAEFVDHNLNSEYRSLFVGTEQQEKSGALSWNALPPAAEFHR